MSSKVKKALQRSFSWSVGRSHHTQTSHWLPPEECWATDKNGLPYGWEEAFDKTGKPYYINHIDQLTTTDDPREDPDYVQVVPAPREVELWRDPHMGFGFVAGSEKPVIVRCVTEDSSFPSLPEMEDDEVYISDIGGPSQDRLLAGDQIIEINGEDVKRAPREYVIDLVRSCKQSISLTVCQPILDNSSRKSAMLTAAKKARLKSNPNRVRFAEAITVNGDTVRHPSISENCLPFLPNVLKVFLENGQTKSFKYDTTTTVRDVLCSLQEKLGITRSDHFALVLHDMKSPNPAQLSYLREDDILSEIAARPGSQHFKCSYRLAFLPDDPDEILRRDRIAFDYFYDQCCNDVVDGKFSSELKHETALKLASLHIYQHALGKGMTKISVKIIAKESGLDTFLPRTLIENTKSKDLRKMISHYIKANLSHSGIHRLTELEAKLAYVEMVGELRLYGSRCFMVTIVEKKCDSMLLVGPRYGISAVTSIKNNAYSMLTSFAEIDTLVISRDDNDSMHKIQIKKMKPKPVCSLLMMNDDISDFMALVEGYYRLIMDSDREIFVIASDGLDANRNGIPSYHDVHSVLPLSWSYVDEGEQNDMNSSTERLLDLTSGPPEYPKQLSVDELDKKLEAEAAQNKEQQVESVDECSLGVVVPNSCLYDAIISGIGPINSTSPPLFDMTLITEHMEQNDAVTDTEQVEITVEEQLDTRETDSVTTEDSNTTSDSQPLLQHYVETDDLMYIDQNNVNHQEELYDMERSMSYSESESDSYSTPTDSPYKMKLGGLDLVPPDLYDQQKAERPQSFGLRSPDALPRSAQEYENIAKSFGLRSPDQLDQMDQTFEEQFREIDTYMGKDLIDLTMMTGKTEDDDPMMDFTALPPGDEMTNHERMLAAEDEESANQRLLESASIGSETDSGNETINSENTDLLNSTDFSPSVPVLEEAETSFCAEHEPEEEVVLGASIKSEIAALVFPHDFEPRIRNLRSNLRRSHSAQETGLKSSHVFRSNSTATTPTGSVNFDSNSDFSSLETVIRVSQDKNSGSDLAVEDQTNNAQSPEHPVDEIIETEEYAEQQEGPSKPQIMELPLNPATTMATLGTQTSPQIAEKTSNFSNQNFSTPISSSQITISDSGEIRCISTLVLFKTGDTEITDVRAKTKFHQAAMEQGDVNPITDRPSRTRSKTKDLRRKLLHNQVNNVTQRPSSVMELRTFSEDTGSTDPPAMRRSASEERTSISDPPPERVVSKLFRSPLKSHYSRQVVTERSRSFDATNMTYQSSQSTSALNDTKGKRIPTKVILRANSETGSLANGTMATSSQDRRSRSIDCSNNSGNDFPIPNNLSSEDENPAEINQAENGSDGAEGPQDAELDLQDEHNTFTHTVNSILNRQFMGDSIFELARADITSLIAAMKGQIKSRDKQKSEVTKQQFDLLRESLVIEARQFASDAKALVSSATHSEHHVIEQVHSSLKTFARIVNYTLISIQKLNGDSVTTLVTKVVRVGEAYLQTVNAAEKAAGLGMDHSSMKYLMRQATGLATVLSALMKALKCMVSRIE